MRYMDSMLIVYYPLGLPNPLLLESLNGVPHSLPLSSNVWIFKTAFPIKTLYAILQPQTSEDDDLLIMKLTKQYISNLSGRDRAWLNKYIV